MQKRMKWLPIAAFLWFGCVPAPTAFARGAAGAGRPGQGAKATGSSSLSTATAKKSSKKHRHHTQRESLQKAPTPDRISEIQSALTRVGYYQGDPNGKWDSNTIAAVEKFQSANDIDPTGKLDAPTLQKLGLGSDIAGVSAPRVVAPPLANLTPPSSPASNPPSTSSSGSHPALH
jgi:peptidoglycan hydrolase-like protein with peptidoglycan-binding domain